MTDGLALQVADPRGVRAPDRVPGDSGLLGIHDGAVDLRALGDGRPHQAMAHDGSSSAARRDERPASSWLKAKLRPWSK